MVYQVLFCTGAIGFMLLALLGFVHGHGGAGRAHAHGGHLGHGHAGHGHGPHLPTKIAHHGSHAPLKGAHDTSHSSAGDAQSSGSVVLHWAQAAGWLLISPLDLFSLAIGAGLMGMILRRYHAGVSLTAFGAILGAIVFNFLIIKPIIGLVFRAAAPASEGLEGTVSQLASAETAFDQQGRGLVKLVLDGQVVQLLGKLDYAEVKSGTHVSKGDQVLILEVDAKRNTCKVSRELA